MNTAQKSIVCSAVELAITYPVAKYVVVPAEARFFEKHGMRRTARYIRFCQRHQFKACVALLVMHGIAYVVAAEKKETQEVVA